MIEPVDRWEPWQRPDVVLLSGPDRVSDEPDPEFKPRPVGFVLPKTKPTTEPMTWEGDNA